MRWRSTSRSRGCRGRRTRRRPSPLAGTGCFFRRHTPNTMSACVSDLESIVPLDNTTVPALDRPEGIVVQALPTAFSALAWIASSCAGAAEPRPGASGAWRVCSRCWRPRPARSSRGASWSSWRARITRRASRGACSVPPAASRRGRCSCLRSSRALRAWPSCSRSPSHPAPSWRTWGCAAGGSTRRPRRCRCVAVQAAVGHDRRSCCSCGCRRAATARCRSLRRRRRRRSWWWTR